MGRCLVRTGHSRAASTAWSPVELAISQTSGLLDPPWAEADDRQWLADDSKSHPPVRRRWQLGSMRTTSRNRCAPRRPCGCGTRRCPAERTRSAAWSSTAATDVRAVLQHRVLALGI